MKIARHDNVSGRSGTQSNFRQTISMAECEWMPPKLTNEMIDAAIEGFEAHKRRIDDQISELRAMRSASPAPSASASTKQPRRKMSAAGRKAIAAAQRKRWAASKVEVQTKSPRAKPAKKKRILSAEGKANIIAALQKRWAAKKAAAKK